MKEIKKQKNRKKDFKMVALLLVVVFVINFGVFLYFTVFTKVCKDSSTCDGWYCEHIFLRENGLITKFLERHYREECTKDFGVLDYGYSARSFWLYFDCRVPYSDSGKHCKNSNECKGNCQYKGYIPSSCVEEEGDVYICSEDITGKCSEFKEKSGYYEVLDGELHGHWNRDRIWLRDIVYY